MSQPPPANEAAPTPSPAPPTSTDADLIGLFEFTESTTPPLTPALSPLSSTTRQWELLRPTSLLTPPQEPAKVLPPVSPIPATAPLPASSVPPTPTATNVPLPSSPISSAPTMPHNDLERIESHDSVSSANSRSSSVSASILSATAPSFARRIPVKRSADPLSFFPGEGEASAPTVAPALRASRSAPPPNETDEPDPEMEFYRSQRRPLTPSVYGAEESWGGGYDLGQGRGLGLEHGGEDVAPVKPPFTFDGKILVASGLPHPQISATESKAARISRPSEAAASGSQPSSPPDDKLRSTTPLSTTTAAPALPAEIAEVKPELEGEEVGDTTVKGDDMAIETLARSLSAVSLRPLAASPAHSLDVEVEPVEPVPTQSDADKQAMLDATTKEEPTTQKDDDGPGNETVRAETFLDILLDLEEGGKSLRGHLTDFIARFDEDVERLKGQKGPDLIPPPTIVARARALQNLVESQRKKIQSLEQKVIVTKDKLERAETRLVVCELEKKDWTKQKAVLAQKHIELEDRYQELEARAEAGGEKPYSVVLLEGEPRMFDYDLVKRGHGGGESVARTICDRVTDIQNARGLPTSPTIIKLFVDVPDVQRRLLEAGIIGERSDLNDFLEGLNDHRPLHCVIDVCSQEPMWRKISGHLERYLSSKACTMVLIGAASPAPYASTIAKLSAAKAKLHAVHTKSKNGWVDIVGANNIIPVALLYPLDQVAWDNLSREILSRSGGSILETATMRTESPPPPTIIAPGSPASTESRGTIRAPSLSPSPPPVIAPPPWRQVTADVAPPTEYAPTVHMTPAHTGGSYLDQYYANHPDPSSLPPPRSIASVSQQPPPPPHRSASVAHSYRSSGVAALEIPISSHAELESPPESDEDEPSVNVPHSSRHFVQRPVKIAQEDDDDDTRSTTSRATSLAPSEVSFAPSVSSHVPSGSRDREIPPHIQRLAGGALGGNVRPASQAGSVRSASEASPLRSASQAGFSRHGFRKASASGTNANLVPLGNSSRAPLKIDVGSNRDRAARRRTSEYQKLRAFDPPPCHDLYLSGRCSAPFCQFGHKYELNQSDVYMLRHLAKEMNCEVVHRGRECLFTEDECIYSHRCPFGQFCEFGEKCWFSREAH